MKVSTFASMNAECCCRICVMLSLQRCLPWGVVSDCPVGVLNLPS